MAPFCHDGPSISSTVMAYVEMDNEAQESSESSDEDDVEELAEVYPPPPNGLPESLPLENSLPQLLLSQCGVSEEYELADRTSIRLRIISKEMSLQRLSIYMPSLIELDLSGSWLLSLRDLGCGLRIKILKVANCSLDCLDGLLGLTTLKELHAQSNCIRDIGSCTVLPRLQLLDVSRNRVEDLGVISFLSICSQLRDLNLSENPVSFYPEYRDVVMEVLPGLCRLDGETLAVDETKTVNAEDCNKIEDVDKESFDISSNGKELNEADQQKITKVSTSSSTVNEDLITCKSTVKIRERPSTSIGFRQSPNSSRRLQRPHTAGPNKTTRDVLNEDTSVLSDVHNIEENSASRLTSGGIVCGNLTAALRRRPRQNKQEILESWSHQPTKNCDSSASSANVEIDNNPTAINRLNTPEVKCDKKRTKEIRALLEASRRWRAAYSKFRDINREKWAKETSHDIISEEDEEDEECENKSGDNVRT